MYDRQFVSEQTVGELPETPSPQPFTTEDPPHTLTDQNSLQSWKELYMARRSWALNLTVKCTPLAKSIDEHNERTDIIHRSVGVALENLKSHVGSLETKFQEAQNWANGLLKEQQSALKEWHRALEGLEQIPAKTDFAFLRQASTPKNATSRRAGNLQEYIDVEHMDYAASQVSEISQHFSHRMVDMEKSVRGIASKTEALVDETSQAPALEGAHNLLDEIETVARKISADYEHVLVLPNSSKTLSSVSRIALNHTKDLLPSMVEVGSEMQNTLQHAINGRNSAVRNAVGYMQTISSIESQLAKLRAEIADLAVDTGVLDKLYTVFHLPVLYGSMLIESIRRREWTDKIKTDSLALAEELAVLRDEEQRRRKKWVKRMGDFLPTIDDNPPSVEVNLHGGQEIQWPEVSRKDVEAYIEDLKSRDGMAEAVQELTQVFNDLDAPTRHQRRRAKAFKQGSVFDLGRSSFLLRGDDAMRGLQEEKSKIEDKLKGSESRVRRLEDLLHRQSHISRPVNANFGPDAPMSPASPRPDTTSRRSSVSSRRMSSNHPPEDKTLVLKVAALEAELASEKETVAKLQRDADLERQNNVDKIEEIQLTKDDLMKNLEAKQREFEDERKFLESVTNKLKIKVEEFEEELDKMMDSRDQEKHEADEKIEFLQHELYNAQKNAPQKLEKQVDNELVTQNKELREQVQLADANQKDWCHTLQAVHQHLSPGGSSPKELSNLVKTIEILAEGFAIHTKTSDENAAKLSDENEALTQNLSDMELKTKSLTQSLEEANSERDKLDSIIKKLKPKLEEAKEELRKERKQLGALKTNLATEKDETEALKQRITAEEEKVTSLNEQLGGVESQKSTLENEVATWKEKAENPGPEPGVTGNGEMPLSWFDSRGARARELSQKLHVYMEQLCRIIGQMGFTIIFQGDEMVIQRTSKVNNGSMIGESSLASSSFTPTIQDPEVMRWMQADSEEEELSKFTAFVAALDRLKVETCADTVIKRVKDIETVARKWQKETRLYRDKYHRAHSEAHDKIAYRSFKEGDLALFLPTRNQAIRSWAAFNVGAPHYFLREQDVHKLHTRDWILARISKVEERVVDLSKSINGRSTADANDGGASASIEDDNPFELSDGLRWYLLDASEEKPRAPSTPGLGKSTVASAHVDARGSMRLKKGSMAGAVTKNLTRSLDSRRNSSTSKRGTPVPTPTPTPALQPAQPAGGDDNGDENGDGDNVLPAEGDLNAQERREQAPIFDEVRKDLLSGSSR